MEINKKEFHKLLLKSAVDKTTGIFVGQLLMLDLITEELLNQTKLIPQGEPISDEDGKKILFYIINWIKDMDIEVSDNLVKYINLHFKGEK